MSALPPALAELTREEKLTLLARLTRERGRARPVPAAAMRPRTYPLAFAQQRFWFLHQLDPQSWADHIFRALRLTGALNQPAMSLALAALARRHEALRTRFPEEGGEPRQVAEPVLPGSGPLLPLIDLSALPQAAAAALARVLGAEESRRPFDLARGPLFRAHLLRLAPREHVLFLCLHHIVGDGWSLGLLLRELTALYAAFAAGRRPPLGATPAARFGDFARAQRGRLSGAALDQELAFWRERLAGAPAVLELPADHPRRQLASPRGGLVALAVPAATAARFKALAQAAGATPFMALLGLFDLLLCRYTGQDDLVVGVPVANRNRTELEEVVGCFASTLLVRTRIDRAAGFGALLAQVRREALAVFAHSDLPFEKLVEELQPERNLSHNPLFQVMFALQQGAPGGAAVPEAMPGLAIAALPVDRGLAKLDLTLEMAETAGEGTPGAAAGFGGYFEYSTDLFEEATIRRLAGHFQALLAAVLAAPERAVGELPLLTAAERRQLLVERNQRWLGLPPPVPAAMAARARATPGAPAVVCGGERLTFGELNAGANRLARHLRRLGVGPETTVGVCLERSLTMPMVLLAVLKSGGAWVPLDPEYPRERLALMAADTAMPVLLSESGLTERLPAAETAAGPALVLLDRLDLSAEDAADPDWPIDPESLAYVVYTSGSTGRPKGVAVPHRSMTNHVHACAERYRLGPADRVLQFTSISFDITSEEIFPVWLAGGAVVPRPPGLFPSFGELAELISTQGVTVMDLPTAYWHEWVGELVRTRTPPPAPLRLVVIGTEQALPERVADWLELAGDRVRIHNSYASTEATCTAVVYEPGTADLARFRAGDRVPVGSTIRNCCAYVLDAALEPVPLGVPGYVYIGGPNVSRGYANWPAQTAASFLPDPFAAALGYGGGQRMYRQGDVGRWLPTGDLEYLGRRDDQVKIRGFRVEPAEVAAALARHPAVKDCAVVVRGDGPAGKRLVGYLTWEPGVSGSVAELRRFLRETLPEHMVPAALVPLAALPLTSNGRVDQRALPAPATILAEGAAGAAEGDGAPQAPGSAVAELLAAIWCELLGVPRAGAADNFFDLGGHSLLGTQVVARVRERLRVELPLRALFANPTLGGLAACVTELRRAAAAAAALPGGSPGGGALGAPSWAPPPLVPAPRGGRLPLSFAQQRLWFLDRLEPDSAAYNVPVFLRLRVTAPATGGPGLDVPALAAALAGVVRRHEVLRTTFAEIDDLPRQIVHPARPVALPVIDLTALAAGAAEAEMQRLMQAEARRPFSLEQGPVLRASLVRLAGGDHVLLANVHHIAADGWSVPILLRELTELYGAARRPGMPSGAGVASSGPGSSPSLPALPALPIQYADFARWQRGWLQGPVLEAELAYWRERLRGLPPVLDLPLDRPRPRQRSGRGALRGLAVGHGLLAALRDAGRKAGATPFMVAVAALAALLRRGGGQESFALGVPVAGRGRVETEGLIGLFVNTLVLRCDVATRATGRELIEQVRDTYLDADAHQDVPFEKLVEELAPERSLGHSPLFQVALAFQNLPRRDLAASGLTMTPLGAAGGTAKFDLTVSVQADREQAALFAEYSTDLFDGATVARLLQGYARLLAALAAAPERRLAELPLLDPAERHQLLHEWNPTLQAPRSLRPVRPLPGGAAASGAPAEPRERGRRAIHRLIEEQVDRTPGLPALSAPGETLTYRELDEQANRLARYLTAQGVRPGGLVGICFERTASLVVAMLAVLKAGAAYLPLDPAYPSERLAFLLADSGAGVVLSVRQLTGVLPRRAGLRVIAIDQDGEDGEAAAIAACAPTRLEAGAPAPSNGRARVNHPGGAGDPDAADDANALGDPEMPAYVIYTSGSTGRPKGVVVPHGNVTRLLHATARWFGFGTADVWTLFHSYAFDFSVWEVFGALTTGGRLVVVPYWESREPEAFLALLRAERVTVLNQTPAAFRQLIAAEQAGDGGPTPSAGAVPGPGADPASLALRLVIFGGEALDLPSLAPWFERHGDRHPRLVNMYGITETTVHTTWRPIRRSDLETGRGSVIGAPLPDVTLHLVDENLALQPIGVPGEIVVGGEGVAAGYLGRPELTAQRFVPDPFGPPGARLYRSGDLARRLPEGDVEYLGRIDHQVKVRGFRIELGEIETALARHPAVAQAVAGLHDDPPGNPQLTAWYVAAAGEEASVADLRTALRRELPDHMVPAWFVPLATLPLTANGKVDRRALPPPGAGRPDLGREYVAPSGAVEERLAAIWAEVLRRDRVGAHDDFFALGGHSLLATQALSRMRRAFGMDLPLRLLFDRPTVAGVAEAIVQRELAQADEALLAELLRGLDEEAEELAGMREAGGRR